LSGAGRNCAGRSGARVVEERVMLKGVASRWNRSREEALATGTEVGTRVGTNEKTKALIPCWKKTK